MLRNYFKIAYRNLLRYKAFTLTNILGLAVGIAATIFILLYIQFEFSYDNFHKKAQNIYRISVIHKQEGKFDFDSPIFTPPIGPAMKNDFPEVEEFVRFSTPRVAYLSHKNRSLKVDGISHADSSLFDVFSFKLLVGDPNTVLAPPYSIVLTEETAKRLFAAENPIGKTVKLDNKDFYTITGIVADPPANSQIQFNLLISFSTLYKNPNMFMDWNGGNQYYTFVKLIDLASPHEVEKKFPDFMWGYLNKQYANYGLSAEPYLQPLQDVHLYHNEYSSAGLTNIYTFSAVALLILFIACINFVNLTTARATKRAKEVGIRKVLGANKQNLLKQFLGESILLSLVAFILALLLVELLFPFYTRLLNIEMAKSGVWQLHNIPTLFGIVFLVGVVAGTYPAWYLSSFQAVKTLKGLFITGAQKQRTKDILVVLQFAISIGLIICTIMINHQVDFVKQKELGFENENMVILPLIGDETKLKSATLKTVLSSLPDVVDVTACSEIPYDGFTSNGYIPEGLVNPVMIHVVDVDEDFLQTFEIKMLQGRNFSKEFSTDKTAYLVNESFVKSLSWDDAKGKTIVRNGEHKVIGVVADFHFATLHNSIEPLILTNQPWRNRYNNLAVKIRTKNISESLSALKNSWQSVVPSVAFDYWFLDEEFDRLYKTEQRFQQIFLYFSMLAVSIALLGLLSLASFSTEQRTKEIGIRKVLGASVAGVVGLLSKNVLKILLMANLLAWPVTYFVVNKWLQNFAYRIDQEWWVFALSGGLALFIALLTVSTQAVRAALANPVESLRYE